MKDDIGTLIKKYTQTSQKLNKKAFGELEKTNLEGSILALKVIEKEQYLEFRREWNSHIKWAFWLTFLLMACITIVGCIYHWEVTLRFIVILAGIIEAMVLILTQFLFPKSYSE